jgi:uncharacterized UBP type Zn finger protein
MCEHIGMVAIESGTIGAVAGSDGCVDCLAIGGSWVHLRRCLVCGHVGCCDSSPNHHATTHFRTTNHPLIQSFEPGEEWLWCFVDNESFEIGNVPASPAHT